MNLASAMMHKYLAVESIPKTRHPGEGRDPEIHRLRGESPWIPAKTCRNDGVFRAHLMMVIYAFVYWFPSLFLRFPISAQAFFCPAMAAGLGLEEGSPVTGQYFNVLCARSQTPPAGGAGHAATA